MPATFFSIRLHVFYPRRTMWIIYGAREESSSRVMLFSTFTRAVLIFHFHVRTRCRQTGNICAHRKLKLTLSRRRRREMKGSRCSASSATNLRACYNFTRPVIPPRKKELSLSLSLSLSLFLSSALLTHTCTQMIFAYSTPSFSLAASACSLLGSRFVLL